MRLIDADTLIKDWVGEYPPRICNSILYNIIGAQTIDPVNHGYWRHNEDEVYHDWFECSNCEKHSMSKFRYCPWCGAYMRKDNNNETY